MPFGPAIPLLGIYPRELIKEVCKALATGMSTEAGKIENKLGVSRINDDTSFQWKIVQPLKIKLEVTIY